MCQISIERGISIKRVMSTDYYILKTVYNGLQLLKFNDLEQEIISFQHLLDVEDEINFNDSFQVLITPSQIVIVASQNIEVEKKSMGCINFMKVPTE